MPMLDGDYQCSIDTPMGAQSFRLTVAVAGGGFRGHASGAVNGDSGALSFDGQVEGDTLSWTMAVPKPMPITLTCRATINGDRLDGKVKAGIFGSYPITGERVSANAG